MSDQEIGSAPLPEDSQATATLEAEVNEALEESSLDKSLIDTSNTQDLLYSHAQQQQSTTEINDTDNTNIEANYIESVEANDGKEVQSDGEKQGNGELNGDDQTLAAPGETLPQDQAQVQQEAQNADEYKGGVHNPSSADNENLQQGNTESVAATKTAVQEGDGVMDPTSADNQTEQIQIQTPNTGDGAQSAIPNQEPPASDSAVAHNSTGQSEPVAQNQPGTQSTDDTQVETNAQPQSGDGDPTQSDGDNSNNLDQQNTSEKGAQEENNVSNVVNRQTSILVSKATGETAIFMDEMEGGGEQGSLQGEQGNIQGEEGVQDVQATPVASTGEESKKMRPKGKVHTESPPASPSSLNGTFRTTKGRILEGDQLAASLGRLAEPHGFQAPEQVFSNADGVNKVREKWDPEPKFISQDTLASMIDRLSTNKAPPELPPKPTAVMLRFEPVPGAKGDYVPAPQISKTEQIEALGGLYNRCRDLKSKMQEKLAEKYLQPLAQTKQVTGAEAIEDHKKKLQRLYEGHGAADR